MEQVAEETGTHVYTTESAGGTQEKEGQANSQPKTQQYEGEEQYGYVPPLARILPWIVLVVAIIMLFIIFKYLARKKYPIFPKL